MKALQVDYISSTAINAVSMTDIKMSEYIVAEEGYCLAVEVLEDKLVYNQIETTDGTFVTAKKGDLFVGVLGDRMALKGYSGRVPRMVSAGDTLHVLNMGGILGECQSTHPDLGPALRVKVLGAVMVERIGQTVHARIQDNALFPTDHLSTSVPLVMISGTAMNTGKTWAASHIVEGLTTLGYNVAAGKATGASLMRDARAMKKNGATATATFTDAGVVSSINKSMASVAKGLIKHLNEGNPDVIVLELGDGLIGYYGVEEILQDRQIQSYVAAHIVTASDLAGAWAARQLFADRFGASISAISGPVTDNAVGVQYIEQVLGLRAINAMARDFGLANHVAEKLAPKHSTLQVSQPAIPVFA